MNTAHFALITLASLLAPAALAQHQTFTVNPDASQVKMELPGTGHTTEGAFHVDKGTVQFDPAPGPMSGTVVVNAGSGKTGNDGRDKKMTNEVLEASRFAEISFAPASYTGALAASGDSTIQVTGTFTLHGVAHPLTVPMQMHLDAGRMTAHTNFSIPYVQWGLKDPSVMFLKVAKEVKIDLTLVGSVQ
jgi:polyisoprenoid-binding protein YceI